MSKHETWRTRKFWESIGGLLIEEFEVVKKSESSARRLIDGVIVLDEETRVHHSTKFDITGKDVVVVQTKANRLGMYLLGQALFSKKLIKKHNPKSIRTVAICGKGDEVMEKEAEIEGIEVIVIN
jgi:hypothetical protein